MLSGAESNAELALLRGGSIASAGLGIAVVWNRLA